MSFNIQKSVPVAEGENYSPQDQYSYVGSVRQEAERVYSDFIVGENPVQHLNVFYESVDTIQTELENALKESESEEVDSVE